MTTDRSPGLRTRRVLVVALTLATLGVGAGAALALWSSTGSGSGAGVTGATNPLTLSPGTPSAGIYPGGTADVAVSISNPNTAPVRVASLALSPSDGVSGFSIDSSHVGCTAASLGFAAQSNTGVGWTVPGSSGSTEGVLTLSLSGALSMVIDAPSACQGASVIVHLTTGS